jgi:ABC-type branched-subunit amino acid transport system substrate-binding protein
MNAILDAMRKANSTDVSAVKAALAGLTFADPTGTLTINARTHQAAIPIAIVEYDGSSVHGVTVIPADKTGD